MSKTKLQQLALSQTEMLKIKGKGNTSGNLGGGSSVLIRGISSLNASSEPLYMVNSSSIISASGQPGATPVVRIRGTQGG